MKQTMKQHSFTTRLKSLAVVFGIALAFASCANEDVVQNPTKSNEDNDKNLTTFVTGNETRTSMDYNSGNFYWEKDDYIYVKDDDGILRKSSNAPKGKVASFTYKVPGKFKAHSSYEVYYFGKNSSNNQVVIPSAQSQSTPNNTEHFGVSGDYGTATATGSVGGKEFSFQLEHQPAYLVFQPYTSNTVLQKCYLTKVEVTSDNDIVETYTFNPTTGALDASAVTNGKQIVLTTQDPAYGSSYNNGFPLTNNSASVTTNGAYMVIKPGTHTLKVRYWVKDVDTRVEGAITKTYPSTAYASNTYYDMTAQLDVKNYDGDHYYMYDAQEQYWKGYEWTKKLPEGVGQPTLMTQSAGNYAQSNTDLRYYNYSYLGFSVNTPATHTPCKDLPNVNELSWYGKYGEPRWDADGLWTTMGHLYKGGMWFKKKSVLQADHHYDTEKSVDGTDWRTNGRSGNWPASQTPPSAADAGNYFYLPALGGYHYGQLMHVGIEGDYWSSGAHPWLSYGVSLVFGTMFGSAYVSVGSSDFDWGFRVGGFE